MKMKKYKNPIPRLRNKADKLFQQIFVSKNPHCECCGKPVSCGHHYVSKGASGALRYEEANMIPVCVGCHLKFHSKHAPMMNSRTTLRRGVAWYENLEQKRQAQIKINVNYYRSIIEDLEEQLLILESNQ